MQFLFEIIVVYVYQIHLFVVEDEMFATVCCECASYSARDGPLKSVIVFLAAINISFMAHAKRHRSLGDFA